MKRFVLIAALALVLSFAVGIIGSTTVDARPPCFATCINGTYWVCCPDGQGGYDCFWDGPCDWGPMP